MENYRAIPQGYMTVGQLAKKMGITVRTLHHYDKSGLLSPSSESEGGFRLYSDKDVVKLHQILSLKHLGFSLDDIKNRLVSLDTPADVATVLTEHAAAIRKKIETLSDSLEAVDALKMEVVQMQTVDFKKYADIIVSLQMRNEHYWMIKYLDDETFEFLKNNYDDEGALDVVRRMNHINNEGRRFEAEGVSPKSEEGMALAKEYWETILEITKGKKEIILKMSEIAEKTGNFTNSFILSAMEAYFTKLGRDPFENMEENK